MDNLAYLLLAICVMCVSLSIALWLFEVVHQLAIGFWYFIVWQWHEFRVSR